MCSYIIEECTVMSVTKNAVQEQPAADKEPLYVKVLTTAKAGDATVTIDSRVTDIANWDSRKWLTNHQFWAMHQGHSVSMDKATTDEVNNFVNQQAQALSRRFARA